MAQSLNSSVDLTTAASSFLGLGSYGNVMVGNRAFEFYNDRNPEDFIQIPWEEVDHVAASVLLGGRWIPRFAIFCKNGQGTYSFSTRNNHETLRAMREYLGNEKIVRSLSFLQVLGAGLRRLVRFGK